MKKIIASATVWAGLWAVGMLLWELNPGEAKYDGSWFIAAPWFLAAALFAWGIITAKGVEGVLLGGALGVGAFFGSLLLGYLFAAGYLSATGMQGDYPTAGRIIWPLAGGMIGGIAGACSELSRQAMARRAMQRQDITYF